MAVNDLRQAWDTPGLYLVNDGMSQTPGGSGLFSRDGFTETPADSGFFAFNEISATSPTLTPYLGGNPWVEIYFPQLDPATASVTIFRISDNRTWMVRGAVGIAPGVPAQDFEVPFNQPATYRAQMFDADGQPMGYTDPVSITVEMPEGYSTVHQPLDPQLWATPTVREGTAATLVRPTPRELLYAEGAGIPRHIGQIRRGVTGMDLLLFTSQIEQANRLQATLGDTEDEQVGVLCLRTATRMRIPGTFFFSTDSLEELEVDAHRGGEIIAFHGSVDEVEPPYPGLVIPPLTYDDIDASFATYDEADAAFATYTDRDRAYELAGAAGG